MYTGKFGKQKAGTLRYCLALDESGIVIDDGVIVRVSEDRFYVTATTSGVDAIYREMQRNAIIWKHNVCIVNATGRFTGMNLAGPMARKVLDKLTGAPIGPESLPYLGVAEADVAGVPARLMRIGFVGELGYEIHVPASFGLHVWEAVMKAGEEFGIKPFGVEAQRLLRLEKGHLIVSQDTDALTNPYEAGLDWAIGKEKEFFIGQRSLEIIRKQKQERTLVGFAFNEPNYAGPLPEECHLVLRGGDIVGRVTSIAKRSTVGKPLGLAFVHPDQKQPGTQLSIRVDGGKMVTATVVKLPFYDPEGLKQKE